MSSNISNWIADGELINEHRYSTRGWFRLKNEPEPYYLYLTGDVGADLQGLHIRFAARPSPMMDDERQERPLLERRQIGATGDMTADGWVREFNCGISEFLRRAELGEAPPTEWKRRLYLEWFSQHGRVLIELPDPVLEYKFEGQWRPLPMTEPMPPDPNEPRDPDERAMDLGLEIHIVHADEEVPDESLWDENAIPIVSLFSEPLCLPDPARLNEKQAHGALKQLLGDLARMEVMYEICPHFTASEAYRYLVHYVMKSVDAHWDAGKPTDQLVYTTKEICPVCAQETTREDER